MISEPTILEFQRIIKEEYGKDITFDEASAMTRDLVGYFDKLAEIQHRISTDKSEQESK
jgi:hypothetical protein